MSDVVLAALIGAAASIIVNLITLAKQSKKRAVEDAIKDERLENRLTSIENKLITGMQKSWKVSRKTWGKSRRT